MISSSYALKEQEISKKYKASLNLLESQGRIDKQYLVTHQREYQQMNRKKEIKKIVENSFLNSFNSLFYEQFIPKPTTSAIFIENYDIDQQEAEINLINTTLLANELNIFTMRSDYVFEKN